MVLVNVSAITILLLTIVSITRAATGNANLRRSIATEDDELPFTTATLNDNDTNNTNNYKHSPTSTKINNKIWSLHVSANHRRLQYRYDGLCEDSRFKLKFRVSVESDLGADETLEQLNTFYKEYVSEFNPDDYINVKTIYYSSLQPTEEEVGRHREEEVGKFILWIDGDCSGNVDPDAFLSSVHEFLNADNNLRSTLGEVSVMNCKRFRNSYKCSTPLIPWASDPVTTSTSSTTALASTSSTTVEPITTSSTTQVQVTTTTTQPPPITTSSSTSNSITQAGSVQTAATPSPTVNEPTKNPSQSPITAQPTEPPSLSPVTNEPTKNPSQSPITAEPTEPPTEPVLDCPGTLDRSKTIDSSATLYYAVVPSTNGFNNGIMCGRLEVANHDGWISLGFSTSGTMKDSQAIVGIPDMNSIEKYDLAISQAYPMTEDKQTLRDTSISSGVLTFTKLLVEAGEITIKEEGDNTLLFAKGGTTFGYHSSRSVFTLDISSTSISSEPPTTSTPTYSPTEVRTYSPTYSPTQSFPTWSPTQMPVV